MEITRFSYLPSPQFLEFCKGMSKSLLQQKFQALLTHSTDSMATNSMVPQLIRLTPFLQHSQLMQACASKDMHINSSMVFDRLEKRKREGK